MTLPGISVDVGKLAKPITVFIEKISDAIGGLSKPFQTVRLAKAEAEAGIIRASGQIQVQELQRRAMNRFVEEETKKQENIEAITQAAIPLLLEGAKPQNMEDDWITNFFEKSRIVSDIEMQSLWSRVLAGEANAPGAFSKKTVNLLADLDKDDAMLFECLCRFVWKIGEEIPLIFDSNNPMLAENRINFESLHHLASLSLINFNGLAGFVENDLPKPTFATYFDRSCTLEVPKHMPGLSVGKVIFTRAGSQIAKVCKSQPVDGFFEATVQSWEQQGLLKPIAAPIEPNQDSRDIGHLTIRAKGL